MPVDDLIRRAGLRVTDTRRAVYEALRALPHARADDVGAALREVVPATSMQSVYNALGDFVEAGLVRRIEPAGHPGLYELRVDDNHHHLVCSLCGRVEDVDCVVGPSPCLRPAQTHGFAVQVAEVTFWGICPECGQESTAPHGAPPPDP